MKIQPPDQVADKLIELYELPFGGKPTGKYRISRKFLRELCGRRRLTDADFAELVDAMFEKGFSLVDVETFYVVLNHRAYASYRRVTGAALAPKMGLH